MKHALAAALCALLILAACGDDKPASQQSLVLAWTNAGLDPSDLTKTEPIDGGACEAGTIQKIRVTVCRYDDAAAAESARAAGLKVIGGRTGSALASGPMLLVVIDADDVDPTGKTIDKITRVFRGRYDPL